MKKNNNSYDCKDCKNKNTAACVHCISVQGPSGKVTTKPSLFIHINDKDRQVIKYKIINGFSIPIIVNIGRLSGKQQILKSKKQHDEERYFDIIKAILYNLDNQLPLPLEWVQEYNTLLNTIDKNNGIDKPNK